MMTLNKGFTVVIFAITALSIGRMALAGSYRDCTPKDLYSEGVTCRLHDNYDIVYFTNNFTCTITNQVTTEPPGFNASGGYPSFIVYGDNKLNPKGKNHTIKFGESKANISVVTSPSTGMAYITAVGYYQIKNGQSKYVPADLLVSCQRLR